MALFDSLVWYSSRQHPSPVGRSCLVGADEALPLAQEVAVALTRPGVLRFILFNSCPVGEWRKLPVEGDPQSRCRR